MSYRIQRINQLIKIQISQILLKEFDFPSQTLVTISRVETSKDLRDCKIFVSVLPEEDAFKIINLLNRKSHFFHKKFQKVLKTKIIPDFEFKKEEKISQADKIEKILEELKKKRNKVK